MNPIRYNWNGTWRYDNNDSASDCVGVIAQELEAIAPYCVIHTFDKLQPEGEETDILEVNGNIQYIMINALKELDTRLKILEEGGKNGRC